MTRKLPWSRLLAEGVVIVLGIVAALGVDRWVQDFDRRSQESSYLEQLTANLTSDSTALEAIIQRADERGELAVRLLAGAVPEDQADEELLRRVTRITFFAPLGYSRETWEDLVSTGSLGLISDRSLRQALSAYYNRTQAVAGNEADWDRTLRQFGERSRGLLPPLVRLDVMGALPPGIEASPTPPQIEEALRRLQADRPLAVDLGQVVLAYRGQVLLYGSLLDQVSQILEELRDIR